MAILQELKKYSNNIIDNKIVACQKHKWACQRFLFDLKRKDWEWYFNEIEAEKFIKWMSLFKHRKGTISGQRKIPNDFEKFVFGNVYGWRSKKDKNIRRFKFVFLSVARKNSKSQDLGIVSLYEMCFNENQGEIYSAASKKAQAGMVWGEADWLYKNSIDKSMSKKFVTKHDDEKQQKTIKHLKSGSVFCRLSKDDKRSGDGTNPTCTIIDEAALLEDTCYYDLHISGASARKSPILFQISTSGFNLNVPFYKEYQYISQILNPNNPITDDRYFAIVCELDRNETTKTITLPDGRKIEPNGIIDILGSDEAILKANPVTGHIETIKNDIKERTLQAKNSPEKYKSLLTKNYNCWIQAREMGYMDMSRWDSCKVSEKKLFEIIKGICYVGFDLSTKLDLTSVAFIFPFLEEGKNKYAIISHSFLPNDKFLENKDLVPYDLWQKQGYLTVTEGAVIDYDFVSKHVLDTIENNKWDCQEFCLDPWSAVSIMNDLQNENKKVVEIRQGIKTLSEPTKAFREAVYSKRVYHSNNPVLNWAMGNAVCRTDFNENILLDKQKSRERIDPVSAIITGFVRACNYNPNTVNDKQEAGWGVTFI